jgi:hypothetical protein
MELGHRRVDSDVQAPAGLREEASVDQAPEVRTGYAELIEGASAKRPLRGQGKEL